MRPLTTATRLLALLPALLLLLACGAGRHRDMLAQLEELERQNVADSLMTDDTLALALANFFDRHGTPNEQMRAHYILGRTYADLGEAPAAISAYLDAADRADTTAQDCDWAKLSRVYGQMSVVYHMQNLPEDEICAINMFLRCHDKTGATIEGILYGGNLVRPYYLMGQHDKVLEITRQVHERLRQAGSDVVHPLSLGAAIYILTERGRLEEARQYLDLYEQKSGLLDAEGNICSGWENYYWIKGFYLLAADEADSAEHCFRKAIAEGGQECKSNAYKGMSALFHKSRNQDSVFLYSRLCEASLDSLHNLMRTDATRQAAALYDYSRNEKRAEAEAWKSRNQRLWFASILMGIAFLAATLLYAYFRKREKEAMRLRQLQLELTGARSELRGAQGDLEKLKAQNTEELMAEKEERIERLRLQIDRLEKEKRNPKAGNNFELFRRSKIAAIFALKSEPQSKHPLPSRQEWELLDRQFQQDMPAAYRLFCEPRALSPLEQHTCILLLLGYEEGTIVRLTQSSSQAVSTAKSRANMKLFGQKGAAGLSRNLERLILSV